MNDVTDDVKAAVHSAYKRARNGFQTRWLESLVVVGKNPVGPRGGTTGIWEEGRVVRRFKTRQEAEEYVERLRQEGKVK